jgi:hypothetical protein
MWHYNQYLVKACPRRSFHDCLSWAQCVQYLTPRARLSLFTPSAHLDFGLPWFLLPMGWAQNRAFCGRSSGLLIMWPAWRNLLVFVTFRTFWMSNSLSSSPVDTIFDLKRKCWIYTQYGIVKVPRSVLIQ